MKFSVYWYKCEYKIKCEYLKILFGLSLCMMLYFGS